MPGRRDSRLSLAHFMASQGHGFDGQADISATCRWAGWQRTDHSGSYEEGHRAGGAAAQPVGASSACGSPSSMPAQAPVKGALPQPRNHSVRAEHKLSWAHGRLCLYLQSSPSSGCSSGQPARDLQPPVLSCSGQGFRKPWQALGRALECAQCQRDVQSGPRRKCSPKLNVFLRHLDWKPHFPSWPTLWGGARWGQGCPLERLPQDSSKNTHHVVSPHVIMTTKGEIAPTPLCRHQQSESCSPSVCYSITTD